MLIPKPSKTKQPILKHLAESGGPVKRARITESMGKQFKLTKKELAKEMPKGGKRFATKIGVAVNEMKASGLVESTSRGYVEITPKGRGGLNGLTTHAGTTTNGRRKPGKPKAQSAKQLSITPGKQDDKLLQRTTDIVIPLSDKMPSASNRYRKSSKAHTRHIETGKFIGTIHTKQTVGKRENTRGERLQDGRNSDHERYP